MRRLTETEIENYRKYNLPGCASHQRVVVDLVYIHLNNGLIHELKKMELCYNMKLIDHVFITEAERPGKAFVNNADGTRYNEPPKRRIDIVDLTSGEEVEIETNLSVKKPGALTIYVGQVK